MKAVPVITEEAVQSLEEMIKTRVMEGRFDDIVRLRPDLSYVIAMGSSRRHISDLG